MKNKSKILSEINYFEGKTAETLLGKFKREINIKLKELEDYILFETIDEHYVFVYKNKHSDEIYIIKVKNNLKYNKHALIFLKDECENLTYIYYDEYDDETDMNSIYISVFCYFDEVIAKEIKENSVEKLKFLLLEGELK